MDSPVRCSFRFYLQLTIVCFVSLATGALSAQPQPIIPSLSNEQIGQLVEGEVLVNMATQGDFGIGDTIAVIDDTPDRVMAVIDMLDSELIEIIGLDGERELVRGVTPTPWPMRARRLWRSSPMWSLPNTGTIS